MKSIVAAALALSLLGCGGDGTTPAIDADVPGEPDAAPVTGEWRVIAMDDWELPPGSEAWPCQRHPITETIYVKAIRPISPPGTHHTLVGLASGSDGGACQGGLDGSYIYASGVGVTELVFPEGVGLKLEAGYSLELELHLFNTGDTPTQGTSGIEVLVADPSEITEEAEIFLPGPFNLSIPPGEQTISGTCGITQDQTIFALFPHMHQLGSHFRSVANVGGEDIVLHDGPYDFSDQGFFPIEPLQLTAGDSITTTCTWNNTTDATVTWGNSSTDEMCFSILYRYPRVGGIFCLN